LERIKLVHVKKIENKLNKINEYRNTLNIKLLHVIHYWIDMWTFKKIYKIKKIIKWHVMSLFMIDYLNGISTKRSN